MIRQLWSTTGRGGAFDMQDNSDYQINPRIRAEFVMLIGIVLLAISLGMLSSCGSSGSDTSAGESRTPAATTEAGNNDQEASNGNAADKVGIAEGNKGLSIEGVPDEQVITAEQLYDALQQNDLFIVDLRAGYAYDKAYISGAINIPAGSQLEVRVGELPTDEPVYLIDLNGTRVAESWQTLVDLGLDPSNLYVVSDGMQAWLDKGYPWDTTERVGC